MEMNTIELSSRRNRAIKANLIEGHFATKHSHVSHCLDTTRVKTELTMARAAARLFAEDFQNTPVDTIITLERTKMIGAFLARDLAHAGVNLNQEVAVLTPEITNEQMILRDNLIPYVKEKNVLLLTASATTGMTVLSALEGIRYYGGEPMGVATVFASTASVADVPVVHLFGAEDIEGYRSYAFSECPFCRAGQRVNAVVNSYGYSKVY